MRPREWSKEDNFSQASKSERVLFDGATSGSIREAKVMVAARQWTLMYYSRGRGNSDTNNDGCSHGCQNRDLNRRIAQFYDPTSPSHNFMIPPHQNV